MKGKRQALTVCTLSVLAIFIGTFASGVYLVVTDQYNIPIPAIIVLFVALVSLILLCHLSCVVNEKREAAMISARTRHAVSIISSEEIYIYC